MITIDEPESESLQGELERLQQACETLSQHLETLIQAHQKQTEETQAITARMTQMESIIKYSRP